MNKVGRYMRVQFVETVCKKAGWTDKDGKVVPYRLGVYLGVSTTSAQHLINKGVAIRPFHLVKLEKLWIKNGGTHETFWQLIVKEGLKDLRKRRADAFDPDA